MDSWATVSSSPHTEPTQLTPCGLNSEQWEQKWHLPSRAEDQDGSAIQHQQGMGGVGGSGGPFQNHRFS